MRKLTDAAVDISETVPGSPEQQAAVARGSEAQRALWAQAGQAVTARPADSAPRLYLDSLNEAFDAQATRVAGLGNRVPTPVLLLEMVGAALALGLLALHLGTLGRGPGIALLAAVLVASTLFITFDLDRPVRGQINVPADPLTRLRRHVDGQPSAVRRPQWTWSFRRRLGRTTRPARRPTGGPGPDADGLPSAHEGGGGRGGGRRRLLRWPARGGRSRRRDGRPRAAPRGAPGARLQVRSVKGDFAVRVDASDDPSTSGPLRRRAVLRQGLRHRRRPPAVWSRFWARTPRSYRSRTVSTTRTRSARSLEPTTSSGGGLHLLDHRRTRRHRAYRRAGTDRCR